MKTENALKPEWTKQEIEEAVTFTKETTRILSYRAIAV